MRRRLFFVLCAVSLIAVATPVGATPPNDVNFVVDTFVPGGGSPTSGPFTASGPAVDLGLMCDAGSTVDLEGFSSGGTVNGVNIHVTKLFVCDDGSGQFYVKLEVRIDQKGDNFRWVVLGGDGAYEHLHGVGSGFGIPTDTGVIDIYDGHLHVD